MKLLLIIIGIVLIAVGLVSLAYQGITYTSRETVVDLGPIKATADKQKTIPLPPILGGIALAGGVALLLRMAMGLPESDVSENREHDDDDADDVEHVAHDVPPYAFHSSPPTLSAHWT